MIKNRIKFLIFLVLFCGFLNLAPVLVHSAELEVKYPVLITGPVTTLDSNSTLPQYVRYMFSFGMFVGFFAVFLSLVIGGVMYFLSGISPQAKADAKDRVVGAITGLIILVTLYLIATTINPQLKFFYVEELTPIPPVENPPAPGVYLNKSEDCSDKDAQANTSSISDLGDNLRNQINSVKIIQDTANKVSYVSILYDTINFKGRCQYIDPNKTCSGKNDGLESLANSASIHQFDFNPDGSGVFFFRKPFYGYDPEDSSVPKGGMLKIENNAIKDDLKNGKIFIRKLEDLQFQDVPEDEQDCAAYSQIRGSQVQECVQKKPPTLAGENISSIYIKGNYIVLLVYFAPTDKAYGPWTYCQMYPGIEDINKNGPVQIKWDAIRNNKNLVVPNWMVIIPIKQK